MPDPLVFLTRAGVGLFGCGLMALLFDAIRTVYLGFKGRRR